MAGGPTTVELVVAAADAGCFGFLAAGYLTVDGLSERIEHLRSRSPHPFGVNVFVPAPDRPELGQAARDYGARLEPLAELAGVALGRPRWDDDHYDAKVDLLLDARPSVVSFAFGWPALRDVERLQAVGVEVWVTVNDPRQGEWALELGVDAVVAQGDEAGGHRGGPVDEPHGIRRLDLVSAVRTLVGTRARVVAAGGVMTPLDVAATLAQGADAVACGTAFLRADEAGTAPVHRDALTHDTETVVTRAFTGRSARALRSSWTDLFTAGAPAAYPHVHHLTKPLRDHGRASGAPDLVHLWAGTGHASARAASAADIARELVSGAG
jgi:nitronate monooxygenase